MDKEGIKQQASPSTLSAEARQAYLANRLRGVRVTTDTSLPDQINRVARTRQLPVSIAQEIVFNYLKSHEGAEYVPVSRCFRLTGKLNSQALEKSINEVVRRHEILRTRFLLEPTPVQIIDPFQPFAVPMISLEEFPESERLERAINILIEKQSYWYDPATEPLWRVLLVRLSQDDHLLFITLDHTIVDAWAMELLLRDLRIVFGSFLLGRPSPLRDPPIQFADFAFWQRELLQGEKLAELTAFWQRQLRETGLWPELHLPFEKIRNSPSAMVPTTVERVELPEALVATLKNFALRHKVTLFMVMLTALVSLLHRYTQKKEISITSTVANRHRPETQEIVGWLSDQLVFLFERADLNNFSELLQHVRNVVLDASEHQDLPYSKFPGYDENWWAKATYPSIRFNMKAHADEESTFGSQPKGRTNSSDLAVIPMMIPQLETENYIKPGLMIEVDQRGTSLTIETSYESARYSSTDIAQFLQEFRSIIEEGVGFRGQEPAS